MRLITTAAAAVAGLTSLVNAMPTDTTSYFPTGPSVFGRDDAGAAQKKAVDILKEIMPKSKSCATAEFQDECVTADEAYPFIVQGMLNNKVTNPGAIAGVLALMALESGEMQFNKNHYPGRPGQGTRNMQLVAYNIQYAKTKPELADKIPAGGEEAAMSDDQKNKARALVLPNQYSFETASWYLATVCGPELIEQFKTDPEGAWVAYMACIGVPADDPARVAYWGTAKTALGVA